MLASLVVASAAATLPASFVTIRADVHATMRAQDAGEHEREGMPGQDTGSESSDDDLDERLDDLDELDCVAVLDDTTPAFVPQTSGAAWQLHAPRSPRAPHPEDTLRPPIAS
jgi:hypothetical protein